MAPTATVPRQRPSKQTLSLRDRLTKWADEVRKQAFGLPPGKEQDDLLRKARQADTASHLDDWANSKGLLPPK
jgi:hypothetical protein